MTSSRDAFTPWPPLDWDGGGTGSRATTAEPPGAVPESSWPFPEFRGVSFGGGGSFDRNGGRGEAEAAYESGRLDGLREGEAQAEHRIRHALEALAAVAERLDASAAEFTETRERNLQGLAIAVARKLVQRELAADPDLVRSWVARALELLPGESALEIRLHPADLAAIGAGLEGIHPDERAVTIQWIADAALERGDFLIEAPLRVVDGRSDTALRHLYDRLGHE